MTATAGVDWITNLGNMVGLEVRQARGNAPVNALVDAAGVLGNNDFQQTDVAIVGTWLISPTLRFAGNLGRSHRTYTELTDRDFNGPTLGRRCSGRRFAKVYMDFEASKHVSSIIDVGASHVVVKGLVRPGLGDHREDQPHRALHQPAPELRGRRVTLTTGEPLREEIVKASASAPTGNTRGHMHVTAAWDNGDRESNQLGRNYHYNADMANLRYIF